MGGVSTGGSDNQVSGAEAVASKGKLKTYSETNIDPKKGKTVNQQITDQGRKNRESRKGLIEKAFDRTIVGKTLNKVRDSKWSQDRNFKSRVAFANKSGKFGNTVLSRNFVLSSNFKDQLDGMGYSDRMQKGRAGSENDPISKPAISESNVVGRTLTPTFNTVPTTSELDQVQATSSETLLANNKKGRRSTILKKAKGLGDTNLTTTKRTLGA